MLTTLYTLSCSLQSWARHYYDPHVIAMERKAWRLRKLNQYNYATWCSQDLKPAKPNILTRMYWQNSHNISCPIVNNVILKSSSLKPKKPI